jgi:hypothetical protein
MSEFQIEKFLDYETPEIYIQQNNHDGIDIKIDPENIRIDSNTSTYESQNYTITLNTKLVFDLISEVLNKNMKGGA